MSEVLVSVWVRPADLNLVNAGEAFIGFLHPGYGDWLEVHVPAARVLASAAGGGAVRVGPAPVSTPLPPMDSYAEDLRSKLAGADERMPNPSVFVMLDHVDRFLRAALESDPVNREAVEHAMRLVLDFQLPRAVFSTPDGPPVTVEFDPDVARSKLPDIPPPSGHKLVLVNGRPASCSNHGDYRGDFGSVPGYLYVPFADVANCPICHGEKVTAW